MTTKEIGLPIVANRIMARAKGKCECDNANCGHEPGLCTGPIDFNASIGFLEEGIPPENEQEAKGRLMCEECFARSPTFIEPHRL